MGVKTFLWFCLAASLASAKVIDQSTTIADLPLHYKVVLPKDYDSGKAYPGILAFPPGNQSAEMVFVTLQRNWAPEAQRRGYIVVIPSAPVGRLFSEDGAKVFPEFLKLLLADYKIRDSKFYIAGMSNGGISAFHIAASYPEYFRSVTGFPGYLPEATPDRVKALSGMCIYMHVGELDSGWRQDMQDQAALFQSKGYPVQMTVEQAENHVIGALTGDGAARLFEEMERCRK